MHNSISVTKKEQRIRYDKNCPPINMMKIIYRLIKKSRLSYMSGCPLWLRPSIRLMLASTRSMMLYWRWRAQTIKSTYQPSSLLCCMLQQYFIYQKITTMKNSTLKDVKFGIPLKPIPIGNIHICLHCSLQVMRGKGSLTHTYDLHLSIFFTVVGDCSWNNNGGKIQTQTVTIEQQQQLQQKKKQ